MVVTALRSFLRHLFYRGAIERDLAACVPTIATWSLSCVPKHLPADQIQRVLDSCDGNTGAGKRDYAILLLMARLGLRAGEVVALTLDDMDWEAGLITVRGKGTRVAYPDSVVSKQRRYRTANAGAVDLSWSCSFGRYVLVSFDSSRVDGTGHQPAGTAMEALS